MKAYLSLFSGGPRSNWPFSIVCISFRCTILELLIDENGDYALVWEILGLESIMLYCENKSRQGDWIAYFRLLFNLCFLAWLIGSYLLRYLLSKFRSHPWLISLFFIDIPLKSSWIISLKLSVFVVVIFLKSYGFSTFSYVLIIYYSESNYDKLSYIRLIFFYFANLCILALRLFILSVFSIFLSILSFTYIFGANPASDVLWNSAKFIK